ncbi:cytochrome P450 [Zopfia rhizophila CBS 207.26]|uniref:Cytochrome P450 n=1 Tax=Zopfia rhizophila CBS 207.26 TaxID=1314779 RepID=A0A6A6DC90_9PEZI|nr:cytochrome P450 [Zopfia rhizophila CBS 207.26]
MILQGLLQDHLHNLNAKIIIAFSLLGAYIAWRFFYAFFLSPLRRVPGPPVAKLTHKWLLFVELAGKRAKTVHGLHAKYGPVVQLSPEEVSFNTSPVINQLYSLHTEFLKAPWYKRITQGGVFNKTNITIHQHQQKMLNHAFSQSSINNIKPIMREQMQKLIKRIKKKHKTKPLISTLPFKSIQGFFTSNNRIYKYGEARFNEYIKQYKRTPQRKDLLTKLIQKETRQKEGLTDTKITSKITQQPKLQEQIRKELSQSLPLLNAVINKALRKHSAVIIGLLQVMPSGRREIKGHFLPRNTVVSIPSTKNIKRLFMPFTKGLRQCLGQAMALFEIRVTVSMIVKRYLLSLDKETKPADMDFVDYFIMLPKGEKCLVNFIPIEKI